MRMKKIVDERHMEVYYGVMCDSLESSQILFFGFGEYIRLQAGCCHARILM